MTVNTPPFSPTLRIYPGGDPADASTWGAGADISSYIRHPGNDGGQAITYSGGRQNEAAGVDAGTMSLTLDNRTGIFSTRNPLGTWYGDLRRGTPVVLAMQSGSDTFTRTVSGGLGTSSGGGAWVSTGVWSTDGTAATGAAAAANFASAPLLSGSDCRNLDGRVTVWPTVVATGAAVLYGFTARAVDINNLLLFSIEFTSTATVVVKIWRDVANVLTTLATATVGGAYAANDKWRLRVQCDGTALRLKAWKPASPTTPDADEPADWSATTTDTVAAGTKCGLWLWRLAGNTNAGTVNFKYDDYVVEVPEFTGQVVQWPTRWDTTGANCWAPIQAAGILRRLRQGRGPVRSPLTSQLSAQAVTGYWPLEDGTDSRSFAAVTASPPATFTYGTVNPGADTTLAGATRAPVFTTATSTIRASTPAKQTTPGYYVMWFMKLASLPATRTKIASFPKATGASAGAAVTWDILIEAGGVNYTVEGKDSTGAIVETDTVAHGVTLTNWVAVAFGQVHGGISATWFLEWHEVGLTEYWLIAGSEATVIVPKVTTVTLGGTDLNGAAYAHLWIGEDTLPFIDDDFSLVSDGFRSELASARVARICAQENIPVVVEDGDSEPLGPQPNGDAITIMQDAEAADMGILYEYGSGLAYRPRGARYSRAVDFALSVAAGQLADTPEPIEDDQRVANEWAVSRVDGSTATAVDAEHQAAEGRYAQAATINVQTDDVLADHAAWRVHLGTWPALRWPGLTLNFARTPSLISTWRTAPFMPRITVDTGLDQVAGSDPDVFAEGFSATLTPTTWLITQNCTDAKMWDVPSLDGETRMDTDGSELAADVSTTAVSFSVATTSGPVWMTSAAYPAEFPFGATLGGEDVTVTAITSTTSPQPFTVTRSVNGVVKAHLAGTAISLSDPTYLVP